MNRRQRIQAVLAGECAPRHLEVTEESHQHRVPEGAESHFKVVVVSECFSSLPPLARHRLVHRLLAGEFASGLHALALQAWTPEEWLARGGHSPDSPPCRGGFAATAEPTHSEHGIKAKFVG